MPYRIVRKGEHYEVRNAQTGELHARHTSREKAERQVRLLRAIDHGYRPRR